MEDSNQDQPCLQRSEMLMNRRQLSDLEDRRHGRRRAATVAVGGNGRKNREEIIQFARCAQRGSPPSTELKRWRTARVSGAHRPNPKLSFPDFLDRRWTPGT